MDKIDRKLIKLLQENARYPLKYLAEQVFYHHQQWQRELINWKIRSYYWL